MRDFFRGIILGGLVIVTGCTTHYRESLHEYRAAEPLPFYQRTQEWLEEVENSDSVAAEIRELPEPLGGIQIPAEEEEYTKVTAKVLGISPEAFVRQASQYEDDATLNAGLANVVEWQELMVVVALRNPSVAAAREAWQATLQQYSQADYLEGVLREYRSFTRFLNVSPGVPLNKEMPQSSFPYPGTTTLKGELIREQVRLAELSWERSLRDALVQAGMEFLAYQYQHRAAATTEENVQLLDNLVNVVQDRYATGLSSQADVLRVQAELERQRNQLEDFQSQQTMSAAKLNAVLGRAADAKLGKPADWDFSEELPNKEDLLSNAMTQRQEVLAQEARIGRTAVAIRMGEVMNRPLWSQGYSTLDRGMMPDATTGVGREPFGVQPDKSRPRAGYAQAEAYLAEMRKRLEGEKATLEQVKADTDALVRSLLEEARIALRQMELVRDVLLPLNESAYEIALRAYSAGDATFIDLQDAERKLIQSKIELDASRRDANQGILRLAYVRGALSGTL